MYLTIPGTLWGTILWRNQSSKPMTLTNYSFFKSRQGLRGTFFLSAYSLLFVHPRFSKALVWLQVSIRRNFSRTLVVLDNKIEALLPDDTSGTNSNQQLFSYYSNNKEGNGNSEQEFGSNFSANSFVYVGGLPSFYSTKLSSLALPSAVFEPRFRGSIRNVVYADDESGRPRRQEVMAYKVSNFALYVIVIGKRVRF